MENGNITFVQSPSSPKIITRANNTAITEKVSKEIDSNGTDISRSTLAGIGYAAYQYFQWNEQLVMVPTFAKGVAALNPNPTPSNMKYITNYNSWGITDCAPAWEDPREDILAGLNELSKWNNLLAQSSC